MNKQEFIEKWNVGYEDFEQKLEFAKEMESDLQSLLQSEWVKVKERLPTRKEYREKVLIHRVTPIDINKSSTNKPNF
jgi:hypothetical protein